jgi:hypothetical protein
MIIETDFLDHWKTRLIVRLLGTESAPLHIIRLWSHCQTRKTNRFPEWNPEILSAVCKWGGDANVFWSAILQTFGRIEDGCFVAHQWDEVNSSLIASWSNGGKGGRPKKPRDNPRVNPDSNPVIPQVTHGVTDREEKIDKIEKTEKTKAPKSPWDVGFGVELPNSFQTENCLQAVKLWLQYKSERKEGYKKTGLTASLTKWSNEFSPAEFPSAVENSIASGWKGIFPKNNQQQSLPIQPARKKELDWRDAV